ncbi:MAG: ATP-binding protein, partial [Verrucomicrobiota bacterium]
TLTEAVIASSLVILFYYAAISPAFFKGLDLKGHVILIGNCLFTFAFALVVTVGSYLNEETRLREFRSRQRTRNERYKLAVKNKQLKRTMDELEETEDQLIQSEKMASLGQLSAGVIHEIGNPLNYSNQALFLARRLVDRGETGSEVAEALSDMQESLDRIKGIVRDLRDFSHKGRETTTCFAVLDAIKVAVRMLKKEILDSGTEVRVAIGSEWIVEADRNQLSQVFINLIHNSIQAMSANDRGRGNQILLMARRRADAVQILVRDNGPGIPEENLGKIFDPFFTTKVRGEGTGLGLSICYRIIEANNGTIRVESIVGEYTEFILTVPLHLEEFEDSKPRFAENHEQHHEQAVS